LDHQRRPENAALKHSSYYCCLIALGGDRISHDLTGPPVGGVTGSMSSAALVELKARRAELAALAAMLEAEHRSILVEGEPDARSMGMGAGRKPPSYNVQAATRRAPSASPCT
jgi:hypothetical protein